MRWIWLIALASCSSPLSCDPDSAVDQPDLAKQVCEDQPGVSCERDDQCCSRTCAFTAGFSQPSCCLPAGASCVQPIVGSNDCCSGQCSATGLCVACGGRNRSCSKIDDCCSRSCDNGTCACSTSACNLDGDCCSGSCERGRCVPPDLSVPIDFSRPIDLGGVG